MIVPPFASKSKIVEKAAASLGVTQFITSWAITICGLITYPHSMSDPHATMCLALALLGSASHAVPFWLGAFRTKKVSSTLRLVLCTVQSLVLFIAFLVRQKSLNEGSDDESGDDLSRYETVLIVFMIVTFFLGRRFIPIMLWKRRTRMRATYHKRDSRIVLDYCLYLDSYKLEVQAESLQHEHR